MYIEKTTAAERLAISNAMNGIICDVVRALHLLEDVNDRFFLNNKKPEISGYDFTTADMMLETVAEILDNALTQYDQLTGEAHAPSHDSRRAVMEQAQRVEKVQTLLEQMADRALVRQYMNLPDEEVLNQLAERAEELKTA